MTRMTITAGILLDTRVLEHRRPANPMNEVIPISDAVSGLCVGRSGFWYHWPPNF